MFSNILGGAAGFPVADLGDTVSQSLRFTGSQELNSSLSYTSNASLTFSFWVKIANSLANGPYIFQGDIGASSIGFIGLRQSGTATGNGALTLNWQNSSTVNGRYRDPAAWYHFVISATSSSVKVYVNGVERLDHTPSSTYRVDHPGFGTDGCEGYLADIHCIDGSALQPTSFGIYQEDGVWVPKNYTGTYGTNGFHLDFADKSDLGNDVSGNNNDFTASGFDTNPVGLYSPGLTANSGGTMNSLANAFDGNTGNAAYVSPTGVGMTFSPATDIPFTSLEIFPSNNNMSATFDGTTTNTPTLQYTQVATNGTINSTTPLTINVGSGLNCNLNAIRINGSTILIDNFDNDVDYLDTPTSNYPTINPLYPSTEPPEEGNTIEAGLGYTGKANRFGTGATTMALPSSGEYYWEHEVVTHADHQYFGVTRMPSIASGATTGFISFRAYDGSNWHVYQDSTLLTTGTFQITDGDVIGQAYNVDTGVYRVWINGTLAATNTWTLRPTDEELFVYGSLEAKNSNKFRVNYGQRDFTNTPPTGAKRLQTNNLPEPTIKNGKDHFDVVTWTGDGTSGRDITGLNFQPDFVWMKARSSAYHNRLYDVIRGINVSLVSDANFIDGLNIPSLTAFNSDGFEIGTETDYNQSNETYVAWCWKGGGTAVSNTDGTVTSSVSANTDAGFSIVSYTGGGDASTVGHGLDRAPEFILFKAREQVGGTNQNWNVYHHSVGNNQVGFLNLSNAFTSDDFLNSTTPTSSVIEFGTSNSVSASGADYIAYCWHSVEGFSKFGTYEGNSNSDGPFVYLGFRPAFVMLKCIDFGPLVWMMYDSTRVTSNPIETRLVANIANAEGTFSNQAIDFLSNGFKIRGDDSDPNFSGRTYIYMAFAEHPFGGENAAPATAR